MTKQQKLDYILGRLRGNFPMTVCQEMGITIEQLLKAKTKDYEFGESVDLLSDVIYKAYGPPIKVDGQSNA